jgi:dTDP-4-amino-4,6-dideoxygalactose transaminase
MKIFEHKFGNELVNYIKEDMITGNLAFSEEVNKFENRYSKLTGKEYSVAVSSNSGGFYALFAYYKEYYGKCNVIFPTLTFTSPAWSAIQNGHNVRFCDVSEDTLCMDVDSAITISSTMERNTKTIFVPTLYGGITDIPKLSQLYNIDVIIDSAHTIKHNLNFTSIHSFHPSKPIMMSSGGVVSTNELDIDYFISTYRNFGRTPGPNSYVPGNGFKFYMNTLDAKMGIYQLDNTIKKEQKQRRLNYEYISNNMNTDIRFVPHDSNSTYYIGSCVAKDKETAIKIKNNFNYNNIPTTTYYPLLHRTPYYVNITNRIQTLHKTEDLYDRIINFPIHHNLTKTDLDIIKTGLENV